MLDALAHIEIVGTKATGDQHSSVVDVYEAWKIKKTASNTEFGDIAKKFENSARSDIDSSDVAGTSTPLQVVRLVVSVLALAICWWARFPAAIHGSNRWLSALEFGVAVLVSMVAVYFVVDSIMRVIRLLNHK
jgi:magnesium-transporting ATPase (P-type)